MTGSAVSTDTISAKQSAAARQLQTVAPWVAAVGAALLTAVGLTKLWDLDKAIWWALLGVAVGGVGVGIAIILITKAYAPTDPQPLPLQGKTARQARWVLNHRPLENIEDINEVNRLIEKLGVADNTDSVSPVELARARNALKERLDRHESSVEPAQKGNYREAVANLRVILSKWDREEEDAMDALKVKQSTTDARRAIGGLVAAVLLALVGLGILMHAARADAAAEIESTATQREKILDIENRKALQQRSDTLALEEERARNSRADTALLIKERTEVDALLSTRDLESLNAQRSGCKPLKEGWVVTAEAIGGTWEQPILLVPADRHNPACKDLPFHPSDPVVTKPVTT